MRDDCERLGSMQYAITVDAETKLGCIGGRPKNQIEMAGSGWGVDEGATTARDRKRVLYSDFNSAE